MRDGSKVQIMERLFGGYKPIFIAKLKTYGCDNNSFNMVIICHLVSKVIKLAMNIDPGKR